MKRSDSLDLSIRESKTRLNALAGLDTLTDEQQSECSTLEGSVKTKETQYRAAMIAEDAETRAAFEELDGESRELAQLTERANVGDILSSATFEKRQTSGEAAELQKHFGIGSPSRFRLKCCAIRSGSRGTRSGDGPGEHRRRLTSPSGNHSGIRFRRRRVPGHRAAESCQLAIVRPTRFSVHRSIRVKGPFTGSDNAAQTDATFVANNLSPERLQASFSYRRTDAARFAGLDASLRLALNGGLQEKLDQQAIKGTDGLLTATNLPNANVSTRLTTFQLYLSGLLVWPR